MATAHKGYAEPGAHMLLGTTTPLFLPPPMGEG